MEQTTLQRARDGDERAFRELTNPYRRELQVHCYRMLGSLTDAEDMLQETLLAAWRGLAGFQERASVRTWLYRIATNRCLNELRGAGRRVPTEPAPPFQPPEPSRRGEITWLQPCPDMLLEGVADTAPGPEARQQATEAVELAFVAALQRMPPRQAAALLLRDVLGFATDEVAGMLGTSPTAVKGALQRARAALDHARAGQAPRPGPATEHDLARRFADAYVAADLDGVVALLTDDAWLSMPPAPHEYHGPDAVAAFLRTSFGYRGDRRVHLLPTQANTQPAFGSYLSDPAGSVATPAGLFVLTMAGDRVQAVARFHLDALYPRFGLPDSLPEPVGNAPSEPPVRLRSPTGSRNADRGRGEGRRAVGFESMRVLDLSQDFSMHTPAFASYDGPSIKWVKRLAFDKVGGQEITSTLHVGTHLDGPVHFWSAGRTIGELPLPWLVGSAVVVDLERMGVGDYQLYGPEHFERWERETGLKVERDDILIIHTGYHRFYNENWVDRSQVDETRYFVRHPGPTREFAEWVLDRGVRWLAVDAGSADHPMNTVIRKIRPDEAEDAEAALGRPLDELFPRQDLQIMHTLLFPHDVIHIENLGGQIDEVLDQRIQFGCFPWKFVGGEAAFCRAVAFLEGEGEAP